MHAIILGSGSKGNSTLLIGNQQKILIDVGFSYPKMIQLLSQYAIKPSDIDAILISHTHKDHINGLASFVKKNMTKEKDLTHSRIRSTVLRKKKI